MIVGTFIDKFQQTAEEKLAAKDKVEALIREKFQQTETIPVLCPVSCINNEGRLQVFISGGHFAGKVIHHSFNVICISLI